MEKYCKNCGRVFKNSDFRICPYCGNQLSTRTGRQPIPRKLRHQVFQRDGYRCRECGATNKQTRLHVDHIKPVAKGGTNDLSNLQTLCEACNRAKYTDEWAGGNFSDSNENIDLEKYYNKIISSKTKRCPYCNTLVNYKVKKCPKCGKNIKKVKLGNYSNSYYFKEDYDYSLFELNRKQREINLAKHYGKKNNSSNVDNMR